MALVTAYQRNRALNLGFWKRPVTQNHGNSAKEKKIPLKKRKEQKKAPPNKTKETKKTPQ